MKGKPYASWFTNKGWVTEPLAPHTSRITFLLPVYGGETLEKSEVVLEISPEGKMVITALNAQVVCVPEARDTMTLMFTDPPA